MNVEEISSLDERIVDQIADVNGLGGGLRCRCAGFGGGLRRDRRGCGTRCRNRGWRRDRLRLYRSRRRALHDRLRGGSLLRDLRRGLRGRPAARAERAPDHGQGDRRFHE